ncbi:Type-1 restriction enzyme EcoKI specificity protein [Calidithermus terrae]|uniref:Type-1 restriction enzyme EcoKI specificity protein n=1 Tax=Calidithermus terrae TaxID=1408545 RepID=A0A399EFC5_9DEIN|nr:Type-1 restriction enzyme EcoKI specificity protein [Calidithermus terrae]
MVTTFDVAINQDLTALVLNERLDARFAAYLLKAERYQRWFRENKRGTTIKGVPRQDVLNLQIPLPPLPEQRAIAHVLRTVQRAKEATEQVIAEARELKKSLMRHLFTYGPVPVGEASIVMLRPTEVGDIPRHWEVRLVRDIATRSQYGTSQRGEQQGSLPMLRMNNLVDGRLDVSNLQYVELDHRDIEKYRLSKGDILFNRTNSFELVGKTALFDLEGDFVFASYLVRVTLDKEQCLPEYLNYYMNAETTQARLKLLASRGVSQSNISASKLAGFKVPIPPSAEQASMVALLQGIDAKLEAEQERLASLDALFQSLLHHLMTGKVRVNQIAQLLGVG